VVANNVVALPRGGRRFDTIFLPTDGSPLSTATGLNAIGLARRMATQVVAYHAIPSYQYPVYLGGIPFEYPSEADYEQQCRVIAQRYVGLLSEAAAAQGVSLSTCVEFRPEPAQAIVDAARRERCGLIYIGSHGRSGLSRLFLGSVAVKTLTLSDLPVLVDRPTAEELARAQVLMDQHAIEP
jgi:nucleotide-binding universal stress UspA family protein